MSYDLGLARRALGQLTRNASAAAFPLSLSLSQRDIEGIAAEQRDTYTYPLLP